MAKELELNLALALYTDFKSSVSSAFDFASPVAPALKTFVALACADEHDKFSLVISESFVHDVTERTSKVANKDVPNVNFIFILRFKWLMVFSL